MNKLFLIVASLSVFISCERSGNEIYKLIFKEKPEGVVILNSQDVTVPIMDYSIWLHFKAPVEEINRIIDQYELQNSDTIIVPSSGVKGVPSDWITNSELNSCTHFRKHNLETGLVENLYVNCKNGEALYMNYHTP